MRKLCWFALPFCAAVFAACYVLHSAVLLPAAGVLILAGAAAGVGRRRIVCLTCIGFAMGLLWFGGYRAVFHAPAERLDGEICRSRAVVADWPYETAIGTAGVYVYVQADPVPVKTLLYAGPEAMKLEPGDEIVFSAKFTLADVVRGETVRYYEARGVFLRAYAEDEPEIIRSGQAPVWSWPVRAAAVMKDTVSAICPDDTKGFLAALLTGDKTGLDDGTYAALQRSGIAHIVAVSGMHLAFLAGLLSTLLTPCRRRVRAGITVLVLFLFAAMVGATPSVLRAAFMQSMTFAAPLLGREEDKPTTLSAILFLLLLVNPYAATSISLQLSFAAVAGIYLITQPVYEKLTERLKKDGGFWRKMGRRAVRFAAAGIAVSFGAALLTTPLTAIHFGTVSLIAPLTNLLVLWAVSGAFAVGMLAVLVGMILPGLGGIILWPAVILIRFVLAVSGMLGGLAFAGVSTDSVFLRLWLVLVYTILLLVLLGKIRRPILPACTGICTLCAALLLTRGAVWSSPLTVTALDVGQGQSILFISDGYTALVDCGGNRGNAGDAAADYLQMLGISELDLLILTHCHSDHANGVPQLFERVDVSALVLPDIREEEGMREEILSLARQEGVPVTFLKDNLSLELGESVLEIYAPLGDGGGNEEGLFVQGSCGTFDVLITGDANRFVEQLLIKYGDLPDAEVLVVGHHGSKHSCSAQLLDAVKPEQAIISVGYNTYGHPAAETLARLEAGNVDIYRTDLMGHVTVRAEGD